MYYKSVLAMPDSLDISVVRSTYQGMAALQRTPVSSPWTLLTHKGPHTLTTLISL